ncbi:MAG: hypothetical protein ACREUC_07010, partial [Steroidobacteraceae bacterium]
VWIDDLMSGNNLLADKDTYSYKDALKRPHQLFLGGDQIYADDVTRTHMHVLIDLSKQLIGTKDGTLAGEALEHLMVDNIQNKLSPPPNNQPPSFDHYGPSIKRGDAGADPKHFELPADHLWFPAGRRYLQATVDAQMTTTDGKSHLFALGEFAAMYLSVWSNACWPHDPVQLPKLNLPNEADVMNPKGWPDRISTYMGVPLTMRETRADKLPEAERDKSPFRDGTYLDYGGAPEDADTDEKKLEHFAKHTQKFVKGLRHERETLELFESGLPKVRRLLANIPTYMIFDDHDFTDDWNLNPMWYDRVYATSLGVTAARNALASYALFQDWGNDPLKYEKQDDYRDMLAAIAELFPEGQKGPILDGAANELDRLFGFRERGV